MKNAQHSSEAVENFIPQQVFKFEHIRVLYGNLSIRSTYEKADELVIKYIKKSMG